MAVEGGRVGTVDGARARRARRAVAALAVAAATSGVAPDAASAGPAGGTIEVGIDGNFDFDGTPGVVNVVVVTKVGTTLTLDDVHPVEILEGPCTHPSAGDDTFVQCTVAPASPDVHVEPGDMGDSLTVIGGGSVHWLLGVGAGNDTVDLTGADASAWVVGGAGDDAITSSVTGEHIEGSAGTDTVSYAGRTAPVTVDLAAGTGGGVGEDDELVAIERVVGGSAGDTLTGGPGNDALEGGPGPDALAGAGGNDTLVGGAGTDQLLGGAGADMASYQGHGGAVTASLNGVADDGLAGENDLIAADVENLAGSGYGDTLSGNSGANALHGELITSPRYPPSYGGADTIHTNGGGDGVYGRGGDDVVHGGWGHDVVYAGYGDDTVHGGSHEDGLYGEQGDDTLNGDGGYDVLDGGPATDTCNAGAEGAAKAACELP